jgi:quercetin dioxygenase-like cupin family protein
MQTMRQITRQLSPFLILLTAGCSASSEPPVKNSASASSILSETDVAADTADWGAFLPYFTDETHVLKPVLVGVAKIDAGQEIHPPHRHADEEYLMITKGRGEWYLNGETRPAKKGDILFARAWDYHGVKAANDSPLEFVVFKYSAKGNPMPSDPNPDLPELLQQE